jgi:hypothetical protein
MARNGDRSSSQKRKTKDNAEATRSPTSISSSRGVLGGSGTRAEQSRTCRWWWCGPVSSGGLLSHAGVLERALTRGHARCAESARHA